MIWAAIGLLIVAVNFISNKVVNTNCCYVYLGSIAVVVGALVGMAGRPIIAGSIILLGCILSIQGWLIMLKEHRKRDLNIN